VVHLPSFLGDGPPAAGFSLVHRRVLVELWAAAVLAVWTGSAYWGMALVDLAGWILAGVATYHLGRRLGLEAWPSALGAILVVGSPLLVSNMWAHVFHVAEFASLPVGLWAGLVLLQPALTTGPRTGPGGTRVLLVQGLGLGAVLLVLGLTYQYQWVVAPLMAVAAVTWPGVTRPARRRGLGALAVAMVVYVIASLVLRVAIDLVLPSVPGDVYAQAVSQPGQLLLGQSRAASSPGELLAGLRLGETLVKMVGTYHPLVLVVGLAGLAFVPTQARWLAAGALLLTLVATTMYSTAWTAMTAYPFVYLGAGAACAATRRRPVALGLVAVLFALTNRDLVGDAGFLKEWWGYYTGPNPF
jgi:hypothetical protein